MHFDDVFSLLPAFGKSHLVSLRAGCPVLAQLLVQCGFLEGLLELFVIDEVLFENFLAYGFIRLQMLFLGPYQELCSELLIPFVQTFYLLLQLALFLTLLS